MRVRRLPFVEVRRLVVQLVHRREALQWLYLRAQQELHRLFDRHCVRCGNKRLLPVKG
jgi:hypothetical protein